MADVKGSKVRKIHQASDCPACLGKHRAHSCSIGKYVRKRRAGKFCSSSDRKSPLKTVRSSEKYQILDLPDDPRLLSLMDRIYELLLEFGIHSFDVLTSSDRTRKILTQQVSFQSHLSPEKLLLRSQIEGLKIEILDILRKRLNSISMFAHITEMVGSVLGSKEGAGPQQVHMDYEGKDFKNMDPSLLPWSILVPCHDVCFFGVRTEADGEEWLQVKRGQFLIFRGDLFHCGGPNPLNKPQFRIHAYGVTSKLRPPQNAIIVHPTHRYLKIKNPTVVIETDDSHKVKVRACKRKAPHKVAKKDKL